MVEFSPIDPKMYEMTGRLCAAWAYLEFSLEARICTALKIPPNGHIAKYLTRRLDARTRWDLLVEIMKDAGDPFATTLKERSQDFAKLAADRNVIVHGLLQTDSVTDTPRYIVQKGKYAGSPPIASVEFVESTLKRVQELAHIIFPNTIHAGPA